LTGLRGSTLSFGKMSRSLQLLLGVGGLALLTSCAFLTVAEVTPVGTAKRAPTAAADVVIYLRATDVPSPFEELGLIRVTADWLVGTDTAFANRAKQMAAKLGANAVLISSIEEPGKTEKTVDMIVNVGAVHLPKTWHLVALHVPVLDTPKAPNK
jgi:hypothetical protein